MNVIFRLIIFLFFVPVIVVSQEHTQVVLCNQDNFGLGITPYTIHSREITQYDSTGNVIIIEYNSQLSPHDTEWTHNERITYTYNSNSQITSVTRENSNSLLLPWLGQSRELYVYGNNQMLIEHTSQSYSSGWINGIQTLFTYDLNNDIIFEESRQWISSAWINVIAHSNVYDTSHHRKEEYYLTWNGIAYDTTYTNNYQYQFNASLLTSLLSIRVSPNPDSTLLSYLYDSSGRDSIQLTIECDNQTCNDTVSGIYYIYSPPSDTTIEYYDIYSTGIWSSNHFITHNYNASGFITGVNEINNGSTHSASYDYDSTNSLIHRHSFSGMPDVSVTEDCNYYNSYSGSLFVVSDYNDTLCPGDTSMIILSISGGVPPYLIHWQDSPSLSSLRSISPDTSTIYYYTVTDSTGNSISDSISIYRPQPPADSAVILGPAEVCPGHPISLSFYYPVPINTYTWHQGSVYNSNPQFIVTDTGLVTFSFPYPLPGCPSNYVMSDLYISQQMPHPDLGKDTIICTGQSITLSPGNFLSYNWQDNSSSSTYIATSNTTGTFQYYVTVVDTNNCMTNADTVSVTFVVCTSLDNLSNSIFSISPNPAIGFIKIEAAESDIVKYTVSDSRGQVLLIGTFENYRLIDLSKLSQGIYNIRLETPLKCFNKTMIKY
jgi:hypothetical protein